jgi:formamidopyrimidine-DNA glycosylase
MTPRTKRPRLRPLQVTVWGIGRVWRARVTARLGKTQRWRKVRPELGREVEGTSVASAAKKAVPAYHREARTCRKCGRVWECLRWRTRTECPACQNRKKGETA